MIRARRCAIAAGLAASLSATAAWPGAARCPVAKLSVEGGNQGAWQRICDIVDREVPRLAACNVEVPDDLVLRLTPDLPEHCIAAFHCGEGLIEILPPGMISEVRRPTASFAMIPDADYYASIVVHELTHAAYDGVPCPPGGCLATTEYAAYAMQIRSLPHATRAAFTEAADTGRTIEREELNAMFYLLAPNRFAQKAWLHFKQRGDGCDLLGRIMAGEIFFDAEDP